jgi:U3 small nucleolar RNA-associated protein 12
LGMESPLYILWVLKSVRHAELEQSLLVLPLGHVERLLYYLVILLKSGRGVEICARVSIFLVKIHQNQVR